MIKEFKNLKRSWYGKVCLTASGDIDSITVGHYATDGSCEFEFSINWVMMGNSLACTLNMFSDSWIAFKEFQDLFIKLSKISLKDTPTPEEISSILLSCGFKDTTKEVRND